MSNELTELYRKFRPTKFKEIVGQPEAVKMLARMLKEDKVPHSILLTGDSGTGKSTIARILRTKLGCANMDCTEVNCAAVEGAIETVRGIQQRMHYKGMDGGCRVWILEEVQSLSRAGFAQQALLRLLEETPSHVYFFLCTTDPGKLIKAILTRCTEIKLKSLSDDDIKTVIRNVLEKEKAVVSDNVLAGLVDVAEGSARKALVVLHQIIGLEKEEDRLNAIQAGDSKRQGIELARALINPKSQWKDMAAILKGIDDDPEGLRHLVLSYAATVLLGGGPLAERAYYIINAFEGNFFDGKKASLIRACFEVMQK